MEIIICKNSAEVAKRSADLVEADLLKNAKLVLGLATGSTPLGLYKELIRRNRLKRISFKRVRTFNLDEYVGLPSTHQQSYRYFIDKNFLDHIDISKRNTSVPNGMASNLESECRRYDKAISKSGGIDLQVLGLGGNGHIGFNEPTSSLSSRVRLKTLTERTVRDNHRFFRRGEFQPGVAITMGIANILEAKRVVLLATGKEKAKAVAAMIEGPLTSMCPASVLQLHSCTQIILDQAAASRLKLRDYYLWVQEQKRKLVGLRYHE